MKRANKRLIWDSTTSASQLIWARCRPLPAMARLSLRDLGTSIFALGYFIVASAILWCATFVLPQRALRSLAAVLTSQPLYLNPFLRIRVVHRGGANYRGIGRVILMANHHSNIDPFLLVGSMRKLTDIVKYPHAPTLRHPLRHPLRAPAHPCHTISELGPR